MSEFEKAMIVYMLIHIAVLLMMFGLKRISDWRWGQQKELMEWWDNLDIGGYSEIPLEAQAEYIARYRKIWRRFPWHMMNKKEASPEDKGER